MLTISAVAYESYLGYTALLARPSPGSQGTSQTSLPAGNQSAMQSLYSVHSTIVDSPSGPTNPQLNARGVNISEPADYSVLVQYALGLINQDRNTSGVPSVTLSPVMSGQQHADSLAYFGTFGHWDVQGYKPYMRYTLLGGGGDVTENVGQEYCTYSPPTNDLVFPTDCNLRTIENGIENTELAFMTRDSLCCNLGHRQNILNAFHTSVSIGIAYNTTTDAVYLVEDFVNSYIASESAQFTGSTFTLQGTTQQDLTGWTGASSGALMTVFYDPTPVPISTGELTLSPVCSQFNELAEPASCQYRGAYDPGTLITEVFSPCRPGYTCGPPSYTYAQQWTQSKSGSFKIVFSLASLEALHGSGVYTLYLYPNGDSTNAITSLSVFVPGP